MAGRNDQASGFLAAPSPAGVAHAPAPARAPEPDPPGSPGLDLLSDVLRGVRLTAAVFFRVEAASPWVIEMPDGATLARSVVPRAQHVVSYHVVTGGTCWGSLAGETPLPVGSGDVLVFPHGDPYVMSIARGMRGGPAPREVVSVLRDLATGRLPFTLSEDGGGPDRLQLVCGFLGCDLRPFNPLLASLPRMLRVPRTAAPTGDPLEKLIEFTFAESREARAGGECVRLRLSELMFIEVVRRHLAALPAEHRGWLAGLRDSVVGRALALLHERPAHPWTLEQLARGSGASRSVLAERFTLLVEDSPMQYLTRWRMQLAARLLAEGPGKVATVAREVGYDSEAAFSRAFKKAAGVAPAAWRRRHAARSLA